jgi:drug/metabolite transporter (DMT)-like permease
VKRTVHQREGILLALIAAALWGFTPVATKAALEGFTPQFLSFVRLAAAAVLFRTLAGTHVRVFTADPWIWLAGAGLGADFLLYNYGVQRTAANVAGLVINVELLTTIAFAVWILGERLNSRRVVGGAVTLAGVLVVGVDGLSLSDLTRNDRLFGNVLVMLAGISWSLFAVAQRRTAIQGGLFHRLTPIFSVAAVMTAPAMLQRSAWRTHLSVWPVVMFILLAVFGTGVVYWLYARAQLFVEVSLLAIVLCTIPVFGVAFAYIFLHEPVTRQLILGGVVILAGILLIATGK